MLVALIAVCMPHADGAGTARGVDANPCPGAPHGWEASSSNPTVFGPTQQPGQNHMMVSCQYSQAPKHSVSVVAEYAMPSDPNPIADFYYGCEAARRQPWTTSGRLYFVTSGTRWSYVEFTDPGHELPESGVVPFERVARALLENVSSSAHRCKVDTTSPTLMKHLYLFGFEFLLSSRDLRAFGGIATQSAKNALIPAASFTAVSTPNATVLARVTAVKAPVIPVHIVSRGRDYKLRLRVGGGIDFLQRPPIQRLRLRLVVADSNYPSCAKGSKGKLAITRSSLLNTTTAPAAIRIELCGAVFGRGTYRGTALIIGG